jgi:hypothetical protein
MKALLHFTIKSLILWITRNGSAGIPVPVQYQFPNKYLDGVDPYQSYELKGWG